MSFYLQSVRNNVGLNEGHCRHWCCPSPLQEQLKSQECSPEGRWHTTGYTSPTSHFQKDMPRVKLPQAFKRHFCSSPFWLTQQTGAHLAEMMLLQKEQEGRAETEGEGGCQCLGKLAALHKRFLLYESSQGAAIIPAKGNRAVLGSLGSWIKCFTLPVYHVLQVENLQNTDIEENQKGKIAINPNKDAYSERCCSNSLQKSSTSPHVIMASICLRVRSVLRSKDDSRATDFISNIYSCVNVWPG